MNPCVFSPDRRYRYSLLHTWNDLFASNIAAVIALNPSTADEHDLDPTLRRIRGFCAARGLGGFCMLNAFAFRATDPAVMKAETDPVGPDNDFHILEWARRAEIVIVAWGTHGRFLNRDQEVIRQLNSFGIKPLCWGINANGTPKHPLYLPKSSLLVDYPGIEGEGGKTLDQMTI